MILFTTSRHVMAFTTEGVSWQNSTTSFYFFMPHGSLSESTDLLLAINDWNGSSAFQFVSNGNSADPCDSRQPNGADVAFTDCGDAFGPGVLAVTTYETNRSGLLTHAGIVFNRAVAFDSYTGPLRVGTTDFRRVALHELGHVLGLDHELIPTIPAIMAPSVSNIYQLQLDDLNGIRSIYGPANTGTPTGPSTGSATGTPPALVSAVLPSSRSVQTNTPATAFATIINTGTQPAIGCSIGLAGLVRGTSLSYQTTNSVTNQASGVPNTPVDIPGGGAQSFIITLTPTSDVSPTDVAFKMECSNATAAPSYPGLNTLLFSASSVPTPDIVALVATTHNDGYVGVQRGSGAFAVATVNLGATANVMTVSADTGTTVLPVTITLCMTLPATGQCLGSIDPSQTLTIAANTTPTFAVFVTLHGIVHPDPATKRVFVRFRDYDGVTRGSTSVAVTDLAQ